VIVFLSDNGAEGAIVEAMPIMGPVFEKLVAQFCDNSLDNMGKPGSYIWYGRPPNPGHWEADFMLFAACGQNILVAHERATRITLIARPPSRKATITAKTLASLIGALPPAMRATLTVDNGTEFAEHYHLADQIGIQTFFCDPHAPWQKAASKMPSATSDDICHEKQTSTRSARHRSTPSLRATTTHPENASTSKHP